MDKELDDDQIDILQDYYFGNYASHNEDFSGFECWLDNWDYDEAVEIINRINK